MRIWLIKTGEEMPDDPHGPRLVRMAVLADYLVAAGHQVTFWNAAFNHHRKEPRYAETTRIRSVAGYDAIYLKGRAYRKNISLARFVHQEEVAREFARVAPDESPPDVIVAALPTIELCHAAMAYAQPRGIPYILDCRDMWPDVITEQLTGALRLPASLVALRYRRQRDRALRGAASIVGVTDRFLDWALKGAGRPRRDSDRVFHLAIPAPKQHAPEETAKAEAYWTDLIGPPSPDVTVACFGGTLSRRLDLHTLLAACRLLPGRADPDRLKIVLCGRGDLLEAFEATARDVPHVTFAGWRNAVELDALMKRSTAGLLPYPPAFDFSNHFVNKIGEYLNYGLPIVTGLDGLTEALLKPNDLQLPYEVGNPESLAATLAALPDQSGKSAARAETAKALYRKMFDPERIYPDFVAHIEAIGRSTASQP